MIDIKFKTHPECYIDYKKCLKFLSEIDEEKHEYPEGITPFHVYTEVRTDKELECIKSFLATQNLEKTKLIVWSDYNIEDNAMIQPYKEYLDLRVWDVAEEAKGTPLEGVDTHINVDPQKNDFWWMTSGIFRFLALYKYGGIYADVDMIFLRDFKPILGQNFAYQWGSSLDFPKEFLDSGDCFGPCAAMLGANKGEKYIEDCMQTLIKTPVIGGTCFDEDMLAKVYCIDHDGFTIFPSPFFNIEWLMNTTNRPERKRAGECMFDHRDFTKDYLFLDSFAWHWHNSSNKNKVVQPGSKFDMLRDITNKRLKSRGIL
jgi:hypothetical protein